MKNIQLLNSVTHKNTRVITRKGKELGDSVMLVDTFPQDFRFLQTDYTILFQKNPDTGLFNAVALLGFEQGENLFLNEQGWDASYIPLMVQRQPFHIGIQSGPTGKNDDKMRVVHINMDSPRVSSEEGERLFLEQGGNTEFLNYMSSVLETIHIWNEQSPQFYEVLVNQNLLESVSFDITLTTGKQAQLLGFYTINEDVLSTLAGDVLAQLNAAGYLMPMYMALASIGNIQKMIKLKTQKENG